MPSRVAGQLRRPTFGDHGQRHPEPARTGGRPAARPGPSRPGLPGPQLMVAAEVGHLPGPEGPGQVVVGHDRLRHARREHAPPPTSACAVTSIGDSHASPCSPRLSSGSVASPASRRYSSASNSATQSCSHAEPVTRRIEAGWLAAPAARASLGAHRVVADAAPTNRGRAAAARPGSPPRPWPPERRQRIPGQRVSSSALALIRRRRRNGRQQLTGHGQRRPVRCAAPSAASSSWWVSTPSPPPGCGAAYRRGPVPAAGRPGRPRPASALAGVRPGGD